MKKWLRGPRLVGLGILLAMPACAFCVEVVIPDQAQEQVAFCAQYISENKLTEAEARCKIAIEYAPKFAEAYNLLGLIEFHRGRFDLAVEYFKKAITHKNNFAEAYNNLGALLMQNREYQPAEDEFREALEIDPGFVDARGNLAKALYFQQNDKEAREQYLRCVELAPDNCDCRMGLGVLDLDAKRFDEARGHFQKYTEICPLEAQGHYSLAFTLLQVGRCQEASDALVAALSRNPDHLESRKAMVDAYDCMGKQDGALRTWIEKIRADPGDPEPHFQLGTLYEDRKDYKRALNEFLNTIKLKQDYVPAYYRAAKIYDILQQAEDTITFCQKYVDLLRDDKMASQREWCVGRVKALQYGR